MSIENGRISAIALQRSAMSIYPETSIYVDNAS